MQPSLPAPCPGPEPCGHTDLEHEAFDAGFLAGERGDDQDTCPLDNGIYREAWLCGYSAGYCGHNSAHNAQDGTNEAPYDL